MRQIEVIPHKAQWDRKHERIWNQFTSQSIVNESGVEPKVNTSQIYIKIKDERKGYEEDEDTIKKCHITISTGRFDITQDIPSI